MATRRPSATIASILNRVADAEGALESALIRLTQERDLEQNDLDRLWCFRAGYKQAAPHSVRNDETLRWWREGADDSEGVLQYKAFKRLAVGVAALLPCPDDRPVSRPGADVALKNFMFVTGPVDKEDPELIACWRASLKEDVPSWMSVAAALPYRRLRRTSSGRAELERDGLPSRVRSKIRCSSGGNRLTLDRHFAPLLPEPWTRHNPRIAPRLDGSVHESGGFAAGSWSVL